jgi:hypothetical protein
MPRTYAGSSGHTFWGASLGLGKNWETSGVGANVSSDADVWAAASVAAEMIASEERA